MFAFQKVILFVIPFVICGVNFGDAADEALSGGNKTVLVWWTLGASSAGDTLHTLVCKPEGNNPPPTLNWYLNNGEKAIPTVADKIRIYNESDGSTSLQFSSVEYDIMNAYGSVEFAQYTCVATSKNLPTNYTNFVVFVQEYRSPGTITAVVFLLVIFLALLIFIANKLQFNYKAATM